LNPPDQSPDATGAAAGSTEPPADKRPPLPALPPPARKKGRWLRRTILLLFLLLVAFAAGVAVWIRSSVMGAVEHDPEQIVTIEPGTSTAGVIARLTEAGIVRNPTAVKIYMRVLGGGDSLKAGDYKFDSPISPLQAIGKIQRGEVYLERVTVPEGFDRFDIAQKLSEVTAKATEEEFLELMDDTRLIRDIAPEATNLEGYLFPDTYTDSAKDTPEDLIRAMVVRFKEMFKPEWIARSRELNMSLHKIVTLASIIEEEAKVPDERPRVSSVFYNRLKIGMVLATDPTFIYAAKLAGDYDGNPNQPRHRTRDSVYNTYKYAGLPPGPIASPGRASIEAALYPEESDYLYFVVNGTEGRHKFSRTAAEHELAVQEYRRQQQEQRQP
jgi:UPF0755 protein